MEIILTIALIHLVACLSPGPDIFLVVRNSLRHGWRTGAWTTLGILSGVTLHIAFGLAGISYLIAQEARFQNILALAGATWLLYLGFKGLRQNTHQAPIEGGGKEPDLRLALPPIAAWQQGFFINLLNPKALLFFLSLFSIILGPAVSVTIRLLSGLTMLLVQAVAFIAVARGIDQVYFRRRWPVFQKGLDRGISLLLIGIGLWIWGQTLFAFWAKVQA